MKVKEITVSNYKKFIEPKTISFCDSEGNVNDMNLLLGENGSGKSSILQAIVAAIAPLTRPGFKAQDLDWNGFEYRLLQTGKKPVKISVKVTFSDAEIESTQKYFDDLKIIGDMNINHTIRFENRPSDDKEVLVSFDYVNGKPVTNTESNHSQFFGHRFARQLVSITSDSSRLFDNVGNIYWYTEGRNSYSINSPFYANDDSLLEGIRSTLANAYSFHLSLERQQRELKEGEFDFYKDLETLYKKVFPSRSFVGATPRFDIFEHSKAPDFFLSDGQNQYELSEMSAGERAIFPILMDFAKFNINHSIIIIDEVELHLHSPLQQGLIWALPSLGVDNQFILTSHSDNVVVMFHDDEIIRL